MTTPAVSPTEVNTGPPRDTLPVQVPSIIEIVNDLLSKPVEEVPDER
jgi:hypothetical protein